MWEKNMTDNIIEIDSKSFIKYAKKHFKVVLIISCLFSVLLTIGVYVYSEKNKNKRLTKVENNIEKFEQDFEQYVERYSVLAEEIRLSEEKYSEFEEYFDNSLYMKSEPWYTKAYTKTIWLYSDSNIEGKQHIERAKILNILNDKIKDNLEGIGKILDCEDEYAIEILTFSIDYSADTFSIQVLYSDEAKAAKVLDFVIDKIKHIEEVYDHYHEYEIKGEKLLATNITGNQVAQYQNQKINEYKSLYKTIYDKKQQLKKMKEPNEPSIFKISKKYGMLLGIVFGELAFVCIWVLYLLGCYWIMVKKGIMMSAEDFYRVSELYPIAVLSNNGDELEYNRLAHMLPLFSKENKKIMLLGNVPNDVLDYLTKKCESILPDILFAYGDNIDKNADAFETTLDFDEILLVVQCEHTTAYEVCECKQRLHKLNKKILGCIVI